MNQNTFEKASSLESQIRMTNNLLTDVNTAIEECSYEEDKILPTAADSKEYFYIKMGKKSLIKYRDEIVIPALNDLKRQFEEL